MTDPTKTLSQERDSQEPDRNIDYFKQDFFKIFARWSLKTLRKDVLDVKGIKLPRLSAGKREKIMFET